MKRVLITGGAGFIGKRLTFDLLLAGYKVRILDSLSSQIHGEIPIGLDWLSTEGIEFIRGNILSRETVESALIDCEYLIHLASETGTGQSMYQITKYNDVNIGGTALIFDILANNRNKFIIKKFILASSRSVYGEGAYFCSSCENSKCYPLPRTYQELASSQWEYKCPKCANFLKPSATSEDSPISSASIYAATKFGQEEITRISCLTMGVPYVIARLQNVYGEGQSLLNPYTGILTIFSNKLKLGLILPVFEDGLETRDFVHVDDVSNSLLACISSFQCNNQIINVGSGIATTMLDVARKMSLAMNCEPNIKITGEYRLGDIRHNFADITKLKALLNVTPKVELSEGLIRFAKWSNEQGITKDLVDVANSELKKRNLLGS